MSALGHERTFAPQKVMSALPPKADMCGATAHVCYGPEADMSITLGPVEFSLLRSALKRCRLHARMKLEMR
jgi:hypothetical protein